MKILCTFSGKFGDILHSLATVKMIYRRTWDGILIRSDEIRTTLDFGVMPQYESLLPLLNAQSYIDKAFVIKEWVCTGSPAGDQPWQSPNFEGREQYDEVIDLGYRHHPSPTPLAQFIAQQAGVTLDGEPFIEDNLEGLNNPTTSKYIAYAWNGGYSEQKNNFLTQVKQQMENLVFVDVGSQPWAIATRWIKHAEAFIGCRSANYVLAHGVGQNVICFEPESWRRDRTYSYPYGVERMVTTPEEAVEQIKEWMKKEEVVKCG